MTAAWRRRLPVAAMTAIFVAGCAAPPNGPPTQPADDTPAECNALAAAAAGAIVGALVGGKKNRAGGAAIGAGVGALACVAWNYRSRQTKTAQQVQDEYRSRNRGDLPAETRVLRYDSSLDQGARIRAGGQLTIVSNIEVVQGTNAPSPKIEEELTLHRPDGKDIVVRKKANEGRGAGAFATSYSMTMPEGVQQGEYPVRTTLFVDGRAVANRDLRLQVVFAPRDAVASATVLRAPVAPIPSTAGS